jgi:4-diphosphocytidyl-2-C-methyl-D-erythritol kinase
MSGAPEIVRACAKVNLVLRVGPTRPDGYHEVVTLIARISLADVLLIEPAPRTTVHCPGLPGGDTLVTRALDLLVEAADYPGGFGVHIDKRIPHGAGLGGGSADAAAALRFANALFPQPLPDAEVARLAGLVGSDVPALLHDVGAIGTGRGEQIRAVERLPRAALALAHPGRPLATRDVYRHYAPPPSMPTAEIDVPADVEALAALLENDLAEPAESLEPACRTLREGLIARGALAAMVSGSGSAVFGVFPDDAAAAAAIVDLPGSAWATTATLGS